ncbi:TIGR04255 family protein [Nodularia sp. NIES-3585]|uniref:TIGR04255 family protein n=1 Tax=Nodularia sp. NIES-3585 TaxID=1973477 RepID=UPI000B63D351|nr:TIGR04255 family protein [Nodularia sp. NIES-3585]GAX36289.1 hypothetical protein NIES3585_23150 [Nodularia sp. NIES-3585]
MIVGADTGKLPFYGQPPVREVACSVLFPSLEGLLSPHLGLLWQKFQPEYPFCDDVVPINPKMEAFNAKEADSELIFSNIPPLPRVWFINEDGTRIIQIQRDMFVHNWRKVNLESEYPRYGSLVKAFQEHLKKFNNFLFEAELGQIQPLQYELTYVNQIPQGQGWLKLEDIGKIFPDISWRISPQRFLTYPQSISWTKVFELPDELGRLHTSVKAVVLNEELTLLFELTVQGIGNYNSIETLENWFDIAHEWIVRAFADLTSEEIQTQDWKLRR